MKKKFKIGDIIVGNKHSSMYSVTDKAKNFVGKVIDVNEVYYIKVEVLKSDEGFEGMEYWVESKRFELKNVKGGIKKMKKYIAIQNGCNNIIDGDDEPIKNSIKDVKELVEDAIDNESMNYDDDQGDVVVYELVKVTTAKTNGLNWDKA